MKSVSYLRIASLLTLAHAVLHAIGGVFGQPQQGAASTAAAAMRSDLFLVGDNVRSYWFFYKGLWLAVSVFLLVEAVVFWLLASLSKSAGPRIRPVLVPFFLGYVGLAAVSYRYFFLAPVVAELLIALCLALAIFSAKAEAAEE